MQKLHLVIYWGSNTPGFTVYIIYRGTFLNLTQGVIEHDIPKRLTIPVVEKEQRE